MSGYEPYAEIRKVGARIAFDLVDVNGTPAHLTVNSSTGLFFSQKNQVVDQITDMSAKWASIETNGWMLDGTYRFISRYENNGEVGWWSYYRSGSTKALANSTWLEVQSDVNLSTNAVTVIFDELCNQYCTDFDVTFYRHDEDSGTYSEITTVNVTGNVSAIAIVSAQVENYRRVRVTFKKTNNANKYVRVCEIVLGELKIFDNDEIKEIRLRYETSLFSDALPSNEVEVTLNNVDKRYNLMNPTGIYRFLQQGQGINVSLYINGSQVNMGRFYFSSAKSADNSLTAEITGYDRNFLLDTVLYNKGRVGQWTLAEAVADIISASGLQIETNIPADISSRTVRRDVPAQTTCREALRMVAQAAMSVCYFNRLDVLTFVSPEIGTVKDELNFDRMSAYPEAEDTGLINYVELTVRSDFRNDETVYTASKVFGDEAQQTISVNNPCVANGQAVADWILQMCGYRVSYTTNDRGNPQRELLDTIRIFDAYGNTPRAITVAEEYELSEGLSGQTKAVTERGV